MLSDIGQLIMIENSKSCISTMASLTESLFLRDAAFTLPGVVSMTTTSAI